MKEKRKNQYHGHRRPECGRVCLGLCVRGHTLISHTREWPCDTLSTFKSLNRKCLAIIWSLCTNRRYVHVNVDGCTYASVCICEQAEGRVFLDWFPHHHYLMCVHVCVCPSFISVSMFKKISLTKSNFSEKGTSNSRLQSIAVCCGEVKAGTCTSCSHHIHRKGQRGMDAFILCTSGPRAWCHQQWALFSYIN